MMTIEDLAKRWGVALKEAKQIVREEHVPYLALRDFDLYVRWKFVRFDRAAIESWERGRQRVTPEPEPVAVDTVVFRKLGRSY